MKSKFSTQRKITMTDEQQEICYVNALPGAGKTHTFVNHVAVPHVINGSNSVLVYAAPTDKLLDQTEKQLVAALAGRNVNARSRIVRISSTTATAHGSRVSQDFLTALTGRAATDKKKARAAVADGSIILCTHECIARLPRAFKARAALDRVVLVYDEARACLQDNYSLKLPEALYAHLTDVKPHMTRDNQPYRCSLIKQAAAGPTASKTTLGLWQWTHKGIDVPTLDQLRDLMPRVRETRLIQTRTFLQNVASSSLDVYVSIKQSKSTNEYIAYNVFSPANMFEGFNRVLILSAFFESSQMYHFLNESSPTRDAPFIMRDVTEEYIDIDRLRDLIRRLRNVYIVPLVEDQRKSLSKTTLNDSIVVTGKLSREQVHLLNAKWCAAHPSNRVRTYHNAYREWAGLDEDRASTVHDEAQEPIHKILRKLNKVRPIVGTLITHMVADALAVKSGFFREHNMQDEPLLLGVNASYSEGSAGDDAVKNQTVWVRESLDAFGDSITQLPIVAHGLNSFISSHCCAFLASMKYNAAQTELLRTVVGSYDPDIDRTLDYALQLLWRCNARALDGKAPVLLMVTDNIIAKALHDRFNELARRYLGDKCKTVLPIRSAHSYLLHDHREVTILQYASNDKEKQKRANDNKSKSERGLINLALAAAYRKTEAGKQRKSLSTLISRHSKTDPERAERLRVKRSKLMTEAEWKKTPEGKAAVEAAILNLSGGADKRAKVSREVDAVIDSTYERVFSVKVSK
ncbi:hypothetical protein [Burkholderia gladioli]|uniref:hypothetical protein n=1 Tax=Burkholderia gladioli TaxID=28095 RepID=UPI003D22838C